LGALYLVHFSRKILHLVATILIIFGESTYQISRSLQSRDNIDNTKPLRRSGRWGQSPLKAESIWPQSEAGQANGNNK